MIRYFFKEFKRPLKKTRAAYWHDMTSMNKTSKGGKPRIIFGARIFPPERRGWTFSQKKIGILEKEGRIRIRCGFCKHVHNKGKWEGCPECGNNAPRVDYLIPAKDDEPIDSNWTDVPGYASKWGFETENAENVLKRVILSTTSENDIVMDFFAGSGTTGAVAQKLKRKWICIEKGEQCYSVIIPRLKRVLYYDPSGVSSDNDVSQIYHKGRAGGFFKYITLESYEEVLEKPRLKIKSI